MVTPAHLVNSTCLRLSSIRHFKNEWKTGPSELSQRLLGLLFKVFRYSFLDTITMFFNRLKSDFFLVRSPQNSHQ